MRILLFLATNFAILLVAGTVLNLLGFNSFMAANGVDLNLNALLVFCAIFGFSEQLKDRASKLFMSHPPLQERIEALASRAH